MIITDLNLTDVWDGRKPTIDAQRGHNGEPIFRFAWGPLSIDCTLDDMHTLAHEANTALFEALAVTCPECGGLGSVPDGPEDGQTCYVCDGRRKALPDRIAQFSTEPPF